mmetsp:Transcript_26539/g.32114  ORF Transcript_26539/g.32114 Transcript_26539/m.32114 type:complete len:283 (-) Transcript_26539:16-864(-)
MNRTATLPVLTILSFLLHPSTRASTAFHRRATIRDGGDARASCVPPVRPLSPSRLYDSLPPSSSKRGGGGGCGSNNLLLRLPCTVPSTRSSISAFIDTGAQATVISLPAAIRCGLSHSIDRGYSGMATGVGSVSIFGKIKGVELRIGDALVEVDLVVLENTGGVDLLLGLDVLEDLEADISLRERCVTFMKDGIKRVVPFLSDAVGFEEEERDARSIRDEKISFVDRGGARYSGIEQRECEYTRISEENEYDEDMYPISSDEEPLDAFCDDDNYDGFDLSGV